VPCGGRDDERLTERNGLGENADRQPAEEEELSLKEIGLFVLGDRVLTHHRDGDGQREDRSDRGHRSEGTAPMSGEAAYDSVPAGRPKAGQPEAQAGHHEKLNEGRADVEDRLVAAEGEGGEKVEGMKFVSASEPRPTGHPEEQRQDGDDERTIGTPRVS
jgi:hypothetical protein